MANLQQFLSNPYQASAAIFVLTIWSVIWKGIALWKAARNGQKYWYTAILILNTFGLLEIIYLLSLRFKLLSPKKEIISSEVKKRK